MKLAESGFHPPRGGQWYAQTVKHLLTVGDHAAGFSIRQVSERHEDSRETRIGFSPRLACFVANLRTGDTSIEPGGVCPVP